MHQGRTPPVVPFIPPDSLLQSVKDAYARGLVIDALRLAESFAPLQHWSGVSPCVIAARIAQNTGATLLATKLTCRAHRTDPKDAEARAQYGYEILRRRGAFLLWQKLRSWQEESYDSVEHHAEILALKGRAASDLRDFASAEAFFQRAEDSNPKAAWIRLQRVRLLENQDRVEEALAVAIEACSLYPHPFYRAGVQVQADLLQQLDRDEDAIQLLLEAGQVLQSGPVAAQLYSLLSENGRWAEAEVALERFVELSPLLDRWGQKWLNAQRSKTAYHLGRRADAAHFARSLDDDFHKAFAERLTIAQPPTERLQLDVTFVRQHFKTCAPATLAALGRYWQMPSDHLKLAEEICYDGTPSWQQRDWAERHGWLVREFRVTAESSVALLENGVPFAISTVEATSAHMMAVIGFDRTRGTLLLRDPGQPYVIEWETVEFIKRYRAFGPRGMVFIPVKAAFRLHGIELPEVALYDHYHRLRLALAEHNRDGAVAELRELESAEPDAALTWEARLDLAAYDCNDAEQARCLDRLLEMFPNNATRLLRRLDCLQNSARAERILFLRTACTTKDADPALLIALARNLQGDARCSTEARKALRKAMRLQPMDSSAIGTLAGLLWEDGNFEHATECYRFAANLEGFREQLYQAWFVACRRTRRTKEAIAHLEDRFRRFGARSEQPALTLAWALHQIEEPSRAKQVMEQAMRQRPNDGYLRLRAANLLASAKDSGTNGEAEELLQFAKGRVHENDWLRARADLSEQSLDFATLLQVTRELLQREPLALDAHARLARALASREGLGAAVAELRHACERFPHHIGLRRMVVEWSSESGPEAVAAAARELLNLEPSDAWTQRELALAEMRLQHSAEALRAAEESARIEPWNSFSFSVLGFIHQQLGNVAEARAHLRRAIELSADNGAAINSLLEIARTDQERRDELAFIEQQLIQQVVTGEGLLAYLEAARPILEPQALLDTLRDAHRERADLWHAWAALASQLVHCGNFDEALEVAQQAANKFSHLPRIWLDLAYVHRLRNQPDSEIAAAERAFEINPAWNRAALTLAAALERRGRLEDALRIYDRALGHLPREAQLHASRAHLLWCLRRGNDAMSGVEHALRLAPAYDWAWSLLTDWAEQSGEPNRTVAFARSLTEERAGDSRVWLMLARVSRETPERLAAVDRALQLDTRSVEAWDLKAQLLAIAERFDEAISACLDGAQVCVSDLHILHGRHAWVEARRRHLPEAISRMRAVLAQNTGYVWGWHQLAAWLTEQGALADAATALEQLERLCPHDPAVRRQLGHLRLRQQEKVAAQKSFAAALEILPTDINAAHNLIELQITASDFDGAEQTLRLMQIHQPGAATHAAEINLRMRQGKAKIALEVFKALCVLPDPDPWPVDFATDIFQRSKKSGKALGIIRQTIKSGSGNPQLGAAAVRLLLAKKSFLKATLFFLGLKQGEMKRRAAAPLIQGLAQNKRKLLFRWLFWQQRKHFFEDDAAWSQVGYALAIFMRMRQVERWLRDWQQRQNVQPWVLFNYCLALRHLGRYDEATDVARYVVQTWGHRDGAADMRLFLALEAALASDVAAAQEHLRHVVIRQANSYDKKMLALANALVEYQEPASEQLQSTPGEKRQSRCHQNKRKLFLAIRKKLEPHFNSWHLATSMRDIRRTFRRTGKLLCRHGAGVSAWLWFSYKLYSPWLYVPFFLLCLIVLPIPNLLLILFLWFFLYAFIKRLLFGWLLR